MIKIIIDKDNNIVNLNACGSYIDILSDITLSINLIYERMKENGSEIADKFKRDFKKAVEEDIMFLSNEDIMKKAKDKLEKLKGYIDDFSSEFSNLSKNVSNEDKSAKKCSKITNVFLEE